MIEEAYMNTRNILLTSLSVLALGLTSGLLSAHQPDLSPGQTNYAAPDQTQQVVPGNEGYNADQVNGQKKMDVLKKADTSTQTPGVRGAEH
jgi:hypothetical protein